MQARFWGRETEIGIVVCGRNGTSSAAMEFCNESEVGEAENSEVFGFPDAEVREDFDIGE